MIIETATATLYKRIFPLLCSLIFIGCTWPLTAVEQPEQLPMTTTIQAVTNLDLSQYRWQNRLLLIFAPSAAAPEIMEQRQRFADQSAAFADRELLPFYLFDEGMGEADSRTVDPTATAALREHFAVTADFALLLVGKDGGAKNRFTQLVAAEEIYALIDAMPMRQREMREE